VPWQTPAKHTSFTRRPRESIGTVARDSHVLHPVPLCFRAKVLWKLINFTPEFHVRVDSDVIDSLSRQLALRRQEGRRRVENTGHLKKANSGAIAYAIMLPRGSEDLAARTAGTMSTLDRAIYRSPSRRGSSRNGLDETLPYLLTADDTACLLRTSRKAIYSMAHRGELPGVTRIGRRLLIRRDDLLRWLDESRALSPKEQGR
jgi:excisionase family DNA binding protein